MKKERTKIYVNATPERHEFIYSGIEFSEFIKYLSKPIENLMIITGGSGFISNNTTFERGLELFSGYELVNSLTKKNIYAWGNFCFVDYASSAKTSDLSEGQIAELLYLGHMYKALKSPFFEVLQNRFAYLAHDDGWYCKLYCRNTMDFATVLCGKILAGMNNRSKENVHVPSNAIKKQVLQLAGGGLLIDLDELSNKDGIIDVVCYIIGEHLNMDIVLNNYQEIRASASQIYHLRYCGKDWKIS